MSAEQKYRDLVAAMGMGFHPDTPGDGYTSLPDGIDAATVDTIVYAAIEAGVDVYEVACEVLL